MRPLPAIFAILVCLSVLPRAHAKVNQANCTFTTFNPPRGSSFVGIGGIDDSGNVVGELQDNKTGSIVGFTRSANGNYTTYQVPKSYVTMLNHRIDSGVTVGSYEDKKLKMHGFVLTAGNAVSVNYPQAQQTWLYGISDSGAVVGAFLSGIHSKGFELANGNYKVVAYPGGLNTELESINHSGVAVGYYQDTTLFHGIIWKNGNFQVVNYPVSKFGTVLTDVNNSGVIVGNQFSADFAFGFFFNNGVFAKVVYSGAKAASIGGINNNGVISGQLFINATNQPGYTAVCKY
jgi:hypothetical protein